MVLYLSAELVECEPRKRGDLDGIPEEETQSLHSNRIGFYSYQNLLTHAAV